MISQRIRDTLQRLIRWTDAAREDVDAERTTRTTARDAIDADTLAKIGERLQHAGDELRTAAALAGGAA